MLDRIIGFRHRWRARTLLGRPPWRFDRRRPGGTWWHMTKAPWVVVVALLAAALAGHQLVEPGAAAFTKVAVKPRKRFWRGQPKTHPFQLQLDGGAAPVLVGGSMLQEPMLPSWFLKALALLAAALVALVLIWLLFLQPAFPTNVLTAALPIVGPALLVRDGTGGELSFGLAVVTIASTALWCWLLIRLAAARLDGERAIARPSR